MEHYYHLSDLAKFPDTGKESSELWERFLGWYNAVFSQGGPRAREGADRTGCRACSAVSLPHRCLDDRLPRERVPLLQQFR